MTTPLYQHQEKYLLDHLETEKHALLWAPSHRQEPGDY